MKRIMTVLAVFLIVPVILLSACAKERTPMLYDNGTGLSITMQEGMTCFEADGFAMALTDDECMMSAVRDDYAQYTELGYDLEAMSTEEYAALTAQVNSLEQDFTPDINGNLHITYTNTVDGSDYFYYCVVLKGSDAFWMVTFACPDEYSVEYSDLFVQWSGSIIVQ